MDAVKTGKIDVLMFPVNLLFNMLPQDSADARMKGREVKEMTDELRTRYDALGVKGGDCVHCGVCSRRCPFGIDGSANMKRAEEIFGY